jgi:FkbM family methyltransferase
MSLTQRIISRLPRSWTEQCAEVLRNSPLLKRSYESLTASFKNRDGVIASGPAKGLHFNAGQSDSRFLLGTFEPALQEILASHLRTNMTFYDVGANVGFLAVLAARLVGKGGQVHCFEPLPANVEQIRHNARLNGFSQIVVHLVALAQTDSTASFRVSERPTFGALSNSPMSVDKQIATIEVSVRRLDSLFEKGALAAPDVIKIDIEGSEVDFLTGADDIIHRYRPLLVIELHGTNDAVAAQLDKLSYDCAVVGGGTIKEAAWAALAIATPKEKPQTRAEVTAICGKFAGR